MSQSPVITIDALGTQFFIEIFDTDTSPQKLDAATRFIQLLLSEFENNFSRFKDSSLVTRLNSDRELLHPSAEFVTLLNLGLKLYNDTDGIFNLLIGETLNARGYDAQYSFTSKTEPATIPNPNESLIITEGKVTLSSGQIDLGGYGKGYVIDLIAAQLYTKLGLKYFLINGGGDMYGTSDNGVPITIYLEHPTEVQTYIGSTTIFNCGFAASSPHKRRWKSGDKTYHHIVDTKSQKEPSLDGTFVIAPTALLADVYGTVAMLATASHMNTFADRHQLGIASFTLPNSLVHNQQFILQTLD